jgi:hypothetical protein
MSDKRDESKSPADEKLERRGDNIGQSGRWGSKDCGKERYGKEERWHSTDDTGAPSGEGRAQEFVEEEPRNGPLPGRSGQRNQEESQREQGTDDQSRFRNKSYADAGGKTGAAEPVAPGENRWKDERAEGYDKDYGRGHDMRGKTGNRPSDEKPD